MAITYDFNRGGTIGVGYLGVVFTSVIYGITCIQSFQYYRSPRAKTDIALIKYLVLTIWILDTIQEAFAVHVFYFFLVYNFDNPSGILVTVWSIPAIVNVVRLVTNLYYPIRLFCALDVEDIVMEVRLKPFGSAGSGDMLSRLILLTVATGTLSTLVTTADLIAYLASPDTLYVLFFNLLLAKLDANALLTSLNSRQFIRDGSSSPNVVYVNNEPKAISCTLSPSDSSEECGAGSSSGHGRTGIDDSSDDGAEIVCKVVVDKPYVV
ncbi:hypothetical protein V8D89_002815 [Ganoderma adspersum]